MINDEQVWLDGYYHGLKEACGLCGQIFLVRRKLEQKMKEIKEEYDAKAR
jgi:hypothetical protein